MHSNIWKPPNMAIKANAHSLGHIPVYLFKCVKKYIDATEFFPWASPKCQYFLLCLDATHTICCHCSFYCKVNRQTDNCCSVVGCCHHLTNLLAQKAVSLCCCMLPCCSSYLPSFPLLIPGPLVGLLCPPYPSTPPRWIYTGAIDETASECNGLFSRSSFHLMVDWPD